MLLTSLCVCYSVHPQEQQQQQQRTQNHKDTQDPARTKLPPSEGLTDREETLGQARVKRQTDECPVLETGQGSGLQKIVDTTDETQSFFIQPQPGFNRLVFRVKVNNKFDFSSWKYHKKTLDISSSRLNIDWTHPTSIPVQVTYFKNKVSFAQDRHALRVKVGQDVNEVLLTSWWRTHSYEGFAVYAEGPLKVYLDCNSQDPKTASIKQEEEKVPVLLILSAVGGCFLMVVGATIVYLLTTRCARARRDNPPPVPKFPKSLLFERHIHREKDSEPIYETIDESTLAKLRQNLDSETLGRPQGVRDQDKPSATGLKEKTMTLWNQTFERECHSSTIPGDDARGTLELSLLEEKAALRQSSGLESPMENHYVEMHGIVSRTSSLNK